MYLHGTNIVVLAGSKTAEQNHGLYFPDSHVPMYTMVNFGGNVNYPGMICQDSGPRPVIYPEKMIEVKRAPAVAPHPLCVTST